MSWSPDAADRAINATVPLWNLYGLPALLAALAVAAVARRRDPDRPRPDRRGVVRLLGLTHFGLALWSLTVIVSELWAYRAMGIFPSNPVTGLPGAVVALVIDVPVGIGVRRFRPWARRVAVAVSAFRAGVAGWATSWVWQYGAALDPAEWPRVASWRVLPVFALVVWLLPATARAFRPPPGVPETPGRLDFALALAARLALVVLGSVVLTDAADWALRAAAETP